MGRTYVQNSLFARKSKQILSFIRFYQGDVDGAIELFQKAYSTDLNLFEEIFEMVSTELKDFKLQEKQLWNLREYIKLRIN